MKQIALTRMALEQRIQGVTACYGRWDADFRFWLRGQTEVEVTPTWRLLTEEGYLYTGETPSIEGDFWPIQGADQHGSPNDDDDDTKERLLASVGARRSNSWGIQDDHHANPRSKWNILFSEYIALIPVDLRRLARRSSRWQQWTTLRALRVVPQFERFLETELDCVGRQFVATCFQSANARTLPTDRLGVLCRKIMTLKRHEVLTDIMGAPVSPSAVRIIMKTDRRRLRRSFLRHEVDNLLKVLGDARKAKILRHARKVSHHLINTLAQLPGWACHASLLPLIEGSCPIGYNEIDLLKTLPEDSPAAIRDRAASLLPKVATLKELCSVAESLFKMYKFKAPPIPGNHRLQPLKTPKAMMAEAAAMHNCIGHMIDDVVRGDAYYYRWRGRQRATIELVRTDGVWAIRQVAGRANAPVSRSTLRSTRSLVKKQLGAIAHRDHMGDDR